MARVEYTKHMKSYLVPALVTLAAVALAVYGYARVPTDSAETTSGVIPVTVPYTPLASGTRASVTARANYVITTASDLNALWKMIPDAGPMPNVDFSQHDVLAIFAGQKPTAGYDVSVSRVTDGDKRIVHVLLTSPDVTCLLAQSLTAPYEIIQVPHSSLSLSHIDTATSTGCLGQ